MPKEFNTRATTYWSVDCWISSMKLEFSVFRESTQQMFHSDGIAILFQYIPQLFRSIKLPIKEVNNF